MSAAKRSWSHIASEYLHHSESFVLMLIGAVLVVLALLLLGTSCISLFHAVGDNKVAHEAIDILNSVLLVMMTMEIVYTVAISLRSHKLVAEPFLIIGSIAAIRRMLVITATSTEQEANPAAFHNTLVELGLLGGMVLILAVAIYVLRKAQTIPISTERRTHGAGHGGEEGDDDDDDDEDEDEADE